MGAARKGTTNYIADLWRPSPRTVFCMKSIKKKKKGNTKGGPPAALVGRSSQKRMESSGPRGKPAVSTSLEVGGHPAPLWPQRPPVWIGNPPEGPGFLRTHSSALCVLQTNLAEGGSYAQRP